MEEYAVQTNRSIVWREIYNVLKELDLAESNGDDRMDKPSCATELELLFNKLFLVEINKTKHRSKH